MHLFRQPMLAVGIIVLLSLEGCGSNGGSGDTPPATSPSVPPTGLVVLHVGATSYQAGETVRVTIRNQGKHTISFSDHKSNCTVLLFEHQVGSSWEAVAPCKRMIMTRLQSLQAGATVDVALLPSPGWPTGTYRAKLDYSVPSRGPNASSGTPKTVYSSEFRVAVGGQSQ
jgi:hypothetical protein